MPDAKRKAVAHACKKHGVSQRRACDILNIDRSSVRYNQNKPHSSLGNLTPNEYATKITLQKLAA